MITPSIQVVGLAGLLLAGAALLLTGGGGRERRLRERVLATRDLKATKSAEGHFLIAEREAGQNTLVIALKILGYNPDIPAPFNASLRIVAPASLIAAVLAFNVARLVVSPTLAIIGAGLAFFVVARFLFQRSAKTYSGLLFRQIPDAMSLMLRAVRAGLPVAESIRSVGRESMSPTREEFTRVAGETALGMPLEVSLRRLYERTRIQEYAFFSVVIGLHAQTGGNLSETLENLADMVRRRVAMVGKARALSAEGRLSSLVVAALPFVVGILISLLNPSYMGEFISSPRGPFLIGAFAILLMLGLLSSHWLIQRSVQD